jgi:hypothetical protein
VHDRDQRHLAWRGRGLGRRFDGLQLAAAGAVDDLPTALAQLLADGVGLGKSALAPQLDAAVEELSGFGSIRSFWL